MIVAGVSDPHENASRPEGAALEESRTAAEDCVTGAIDDAVDNVRRPVYLEGVAGPNHMNIAEDVAPAVRVDIDEARRGHHPARIDANRRDRIGKSADRRDGVAANADIRVKPWAAGTVDHLGSGDKNVEAVGLSEDHANRRE